MKEVELKLLLPPGGAARLARAPALRGLGSRGAFSSDLRTVYHDTPCGALSGAGIALRLRREGGTWTQTVKRARRSRGGVSEAEEISCPSPDGTPRPADLPDADVAAEIAKLAGGAPLVPAFETAIRRTTHRLSPDGLGEVELAIDAGEIRAGEACATIEEAELELVSGSVRAVFAAARRLFPEGGLVFSTLNKAERGALLAGTGRIAPPPAPRNARRVALAPGQTTETGAREILAECFDQIAANAALILEAEDPEGPHQLRVGLRRLRSALRIFRPAIGGPAVDRIDAEARWLGREAGVLRDLDVAVDEIVAGEMAAEDPDPGFAPLAAALERRRGMARERVRATLRSARAHAFLLELAELFTARLWLDPDDYAQTARLARPLGETAAEALDAARAKAAKRAKKIEGLSVEDRHELRKALKKLRYAVEFLAPLYPETSVKPFLKRLKTLQDVFGDLNDAAMAEVMFRDPDGPASGSVDAARAAGRIIGARSERARQAWEGAKTRWKELKATPPFWR